MIIPVAKPFNTYAIEKNKELWNLGYFSETDLSDMTLNKKIRNAQLLQFNYILVVGQDEEEQMAVNVRSRDDESQKQRGQVVKFVDFVTMLNELVALKK